jgi:ABC-type spermidine/putrescine transport system permease subunit II
MNYTHPYSRPVSLAAALAWFFTVAPVLLILLYAFSPTSYLSFPPAGFTLKWFHNFFDSTRFQNALWNSLGIALIVTPVSITIALPTSIAIVRHEFAGKKVLLGALLSPLLIPGVITGIAFLSFAVSIGVGTGFAAIVLAMVCFTLPFALRPLIANLHGVDHDLEKAARNLGAGPVQAFFRVTLPQLKPGLIAGATFAFVEAIDNFAITAFLTDVKTSTLPVEAYGYIRDFDDPTVAAMASVLIALSVVLVFLIEKIVGLDRFLANH